ncbi:MAG TPA: PAS domain S-box protein [Bryobacteraceae bacterium]|nr:PAS domain S-box protein [Bryobacteraceae bacterium]
MGTLRLKLESRLARYQAAVALAIAALLASIPFVAPTSLPLILYAPFIVVSALAGGCGPGLLTSMLCLLEAAYFTLEPVGSFRLANPRDWDHLGALFLAGLVASVLSGRLRRSAKQLATAHRKTTAMLESIHDGFITLDREWRYHYVNPAAARMLGKTPEELLGKNFWELWPLAEDSPFGTAFRQAVAENAPVQVEAFYGEPLNLWFEVRCHPSPQGLSLFFSDTTERRRTQEQLRLLGSAILQTSDGILFVKIGGEAHCQPQPIFVNSAFERMTGYSLEDLQTGALARLCGPGLNHLLIERPRPGRQVSCLANLEQKVRRKEGGEFWAEFSCRPLMDPDGGYTHCVWTCRDITARKRAAEESRLLISIVECSDDAIISKNPDGTVLSWNQGAQRIYGYSAEEMVGQSIARLVPGGHGDDFPEIMRDERLGQRIEHLETERIRKDGRRILVALNISPLRDDAGAIVGAAVISHDITGPKRAEKALERSEVRYRSLVRAVSQIVWTTNAQGEVLEDQPTWREFTGQTCEENKGWGRMLALHPDDRERTLEVWSKALQKGIPYATEYRLRRLDGEYRWMAVHGVPVLDERGQVREWVGTCADITGRVLAEEEVRMLTKTLEKRVVERTAELQAANKELEAFAYSVSHDLRAPVRAVDGFCRILLEEYGAQFPAEAQRYLWIAVENAAQMGNLIDGLLAFSRLGRQALSKQTVAPGDLVRQALQDLAAEREGRQVEITVGELPRCQGDPLLLKQVFFNLVSNALKYTRKCPLGRIEVGAVRFADLGQTAEASGSGAPRDLAEDSPVYYVRDNGAGFDMRYADKLFGVFQRLHRSEEYEGTGVGLATVRRIVNRHGGSVWAEAALNQGATFYFTLAAILAEAPESRPLDHLSERHGQTVEALVNAERNEADRERK